MENYKLLENFQFLRKLGYFKDNFTIYLEIFKKFEVFSQTLVKILEKQELSIYEAGDGGPQR